MEGTSAGMLTAFGTWMLRSSAWCDVCVWRLGLGGRQPAVSCSSSTARSQRGVGGGTGLHLLPKSVSHPIAGSLICLTLVFSLALRSVCVFVDGAHMHEYTLTYSLMHTQKADPPLPHL